jgi:hypothetical protein
MWSLQRLHVGHGCNLLPLLLLPLLLMLQAGV